MRDRDDLRALGEPAEGVGHRVRGRSTTPASISSKTIVGSPPCSWAIVRNASAMRESSPPDAALATLASGMPLLVRTRNDASSAPLGPGSRGASSTISSPVPSPSERSSFFAAFAYEPGRAHPCLVQRCRQRSKSASAATTPRLGALERIELSVIGECLRGRFGSLEQLRKAPGAEAALCVGDPVEARTRSARVAPY